MKRTIVLIITASAAALLVAAFASRPAGAKESFDLKGEVYPPFKIELENAAGRHVRTLKAGTYRIKVEDKSPIHDFHLVGPGVNRKTSVGGVGEQIWTVRLRAGTYTFVCDPHSSAMRGSVRVS